jgi:hypothetical protein
MKDTSINQEIIEGALAIKKKKKRSWREERIEPHKMHCKW